MTVLSIIIPCYNAGCFISSTLKMLIEQNLSDVEVIVINDGSVDDTQKIVEEYTKKNTAIKLINQDNKGVSVARNVGLNNALGRYIYFLDSDDCLTPGTLDFFRKILSEFDSCNMICFGYQSIQAEVKKRNYVSKKLNNKVLSKKELFASFFSKKLPVNICSSIYERKFLLNNNILFTPGIKIGEDLEFIVKAVINANQVYYNSRISFMYLIRNDSAMQGYKKYYKSNYYIDLFKSIFDSTQYSKEFICYFNLYLAIHYLYNLKLFLHSDSVDIELIRRFNADKYLLYKKMKIRNLKLVIIIFFFRIIPLRIVFKLYKKL